MVILSVDYGDARTGIAVCDKNEMLAYPVGVITEKNSAALINKISAAASEKEAELIVMGLPKNMDGSEGFRAEACRNFASQLSEATNLEVILRDERLTTVSAHNYLNTTNTRGKKRKQTVDAVAAVLILEEFLRYRKLSKHSL